MTSMSLRTLLVRQDGASKKGWLWLLAVPSLLLLVPFLVLPLIAIASTSFQGNAFSAAPGEFTLGNYSEILTSSYYYRAFFRTIGIALAVVAGALCLGLPMSYWMLMHPRWRTICLVALTMPLMVNVVARLHGWQLLLADSGPLNTAIAFLTGLSEPIQFTGAMLGVSIVMLHIMLPYMVIAIFSVMQSIETSAIEAAQTLGANSWRVFARVVVPLSLPGIISGSVLVFTQAASIFVVPAVIGGGKVNTFPTLVSLEALALNFPVAGAIAICLLVVLLPLSRLSNRLKATGGEK